jgi:hypothetical protein
VHGGTTPDCIYLLNNSPVLVLLNSCKIFCQGERERLCVSLEPNHGNEYRLYGIKYFG